MSSLREKVLAWIDQDRELLIEFYQRFVRAKSPNPPGDTREAMAVITDFLTREQLQWQECTAQEHLPNVVASFDGQAPGPHLVLNGHVDVFPIGAGEVWERDPWSGDIVDGRLHGRGSADMKGGTTAAIFAYRYLHRLREQLSGKLTLMLVSDEETGGRWGSQYVLETLGDAVKGDCLLSGEPGGVGTIRFGEKGILQFKISIRTRGAHGPYAHLSRSAVRIGGQIMDRLDEVMAFEAKLPPTVAERLQGETARRIIDQTMGEGTSEVISRVSMNVGTFHGGSKINMVPSNCEMEVDIRVPLGVDREAVLDKVRAIVAEFPEASIHDITGGPALFSDPSHPMAEIISANVERQGYPTPLRIPMLAASDCRFWRERNVPAFVYGTSPRNVAAPNESALIEEFLHVVRVHTLSALDYLTAP
jgi:succinyl-diaminopimelate desuccinylase